MNNGAGCEIWLRTLSMIMTDCHGALYQDYITIVAKTFGENLRIIEKYKCEQGRSHYVNIKCIQSPCRHMSFLKTFQIPAVYCPSSSRHL